MAIEVSRKQVTSQRFYIDGVHGALGGKLPRIELYDFEADEIVKQLSGGRCVPPMVRNQEKEELLEEVARLRRWLEHIKVFTVEGSPLRTASIKALAGALYG